MMVGVPRSVDVEDEPKSGQSSTILELRNVQKTYLLGIEGVPALRGVSVSIKRGEFVVILGKSGGGKTTMLNLMGTVDKPTRGDLFLCDTRITDSTPDSVLADIRLRKLGFVFQTFNLLPSMTASENVQMPMVLSGLLDRAERRSRARDLLSKVGLGHRFTHYPSQLSGGEQQRVTIARALANYPELLLLDEPTGDLDSKNSDIVMKLLTDLNRRDRVTLVMVTHDVGLKSFADRVLHMVDGKINRIEVIPAEVRQDALATLNDSPWVKALSAPLSYASSGAGGSGAASSGPPSVTVVRKPLDYATQKFATKEGFKVDATPVPPAPGSMPRGGGAGVGAGSGGGGGGGGYTAAHLPPSVRRISGSTQLAWSSPGHPSSNPAVMNPAHHKLPPLAAPSTTTDLNGLKHPNAPATPDASPTATPATVRARAASTESASTTVTVTTGRSSVIIGAASPSNSGRPSARKSVTD